MRNSYQSKTNESYEAIKKDGVGNEDRPRKPFHGRVLIDILSKT